MPCDLYRVTCALNLLPFRLAQQRRSFFFASFTPARVKEILVPKYGRETLLPLFDIEKTETTCYQTGRPEASGAINPRQAADPSNKAAMGSPRLSCKGRPSWSRTSLAGVTPRAR